MTQAAYNRTIWLGIVTCALAVIAFGGAAYALYQGHDISRRLCATLNASRVQDSSSFNARQEFRDLWTAVGRADRASDVPDIAVIDCKTGKPKTQGQ